MNNNVFDILNKLNRGKYFIFPHQLATIDFIIKKVKNDENCLIYHEMGTGKTNTACLAADILIKMGYNVSIVSTNISTEYIFNESSNLTYIWGFYSEIKGNLVVMRKLTFIEKIKDNMKNEDFLLTFFENMVIFIDESHQWMKNTGGEMIDYIIKIFKTHKKKQPIFILLSGTPITNTIFTLGGLLNILLREQFDESNYMKTSKRVIDIEMTDEGMKLLEKTSNKISYYQQEQINIPKIKLMGKAFINIPVTILKMSKLQSEIFLKYRDVKNEMFNKQSMILSFSTLINLTPDVIREKKSLYLTEYLSIIGGHFVGSELSHLENSCKIKFFVDTFIKNAPPGKIFIYFENATTGGQFIIDCMRIHGVTEYGQSTLDDFTCLRCLKKRKCKQCSPMFYIMISSFHETYLTSGNDNTNLLFDSFNDEKNYDGSEIVFLFGTKVISESFTIKESKAIVFLTMPSSISDTSQIITRCIRVLSYRDVTKSVPIFLLCAVPQKYDIEKYINSKITEIENINDLQNQNFNNSNIKYFKKIFDENDKINIFFSYDMKKILYLELKSDQTSFMYKYLKLYGKKYNDVLMKEIEPLLIVEVLRRISYKNNIIDIDEIYNLLNKKIEFKNLKKIIDQLIDDQFVSFHYKFSYIVLLKYKNLLLFKPISNDVGIYTLKINQSSLL